MNGTKNAPTAKMTSVGTTGAVMVLIIWAAGYFGFEVSAEVAAALTIVAGWLAGYITDDTAGQVAKVLGRLYGTFQDAAQDGDDNEPQAE